MTFQNAIRNAFLMTKAVQNAVLNDIFHSKYREKQHFEQYLS